MSSCDLNIRPEQPDDLNLITKLYESAFGPGRFARTAYRVREGAVPAPKLSFTAWHDAHLIGSIRFTAVRIGDTRSALLLGPLAVAKGFVGRGYGMGLMREGLNEAAQAGYRLVILIGDLPYYKRADFRIVPHGQITLPGPVDTQRFLYRELVPGTIAEYSGLVSALPGTTS